MIASDKTPAEDVKPETPHHTPWWGIAGASIFLSCNQQFFHLNLILAFGIAGVLLVLDECLLGPRKAS